MPPGPQQQQPSQENPDVSFPGAGPDVGTAGEVASLASPTIEEAIPLLGTLWGVGSAALNEWDSHTYQSIADDEKAENFDPAQVQGNQEAADHKQEEAEGDLINAIPLVGLARALM